MWKILKSNTIYQSKFLKLISEKCQLPTGSVMERYYSIESEDWVQIIALDMSKDFIMVNQYRHSGKKKFLEFPGGVVDPNEEPMDAACRELAEETGYSSTEVKLLGSHYPNPALQTNKIFVFLALNCSKKGKQNLDVNEDIKVGKINRVNLGKLIAKQEQHALMLSSLFLYDNYTNKE